MGFAAVVKAMKFASAIAGVKALAAAFLGLRAAAAGATTAEAAATAAGSVPIFGPRGQVLSTVERGGGGAAAGAEGGLLGGGAGGIAKTLLSKLGGGSALKGLGIAGLGTATVGVGAAWAKGIVQGFQTHDWGAALEGVRHSVTLGLFPKPQDFEKQGHVIDQDIDRINDLANQAAKARKLGIVVNIDLQHDKFNRALDAVLEQLDRTRKGMATSLAGARSDSEMNLKLIANSMNIHTADGRAYVAGNFRAIAAEIKRAMDAGSISTKQGTAAIHSYLLKALAALGIKGAANREGYLNLQDFRRSNPGSSGTGAGGAAQGKLVQYGRPGDAGRDDIPASIGGQDLVVGSGEVGLVLHRHQQAEVNAGLAQRGISGLGGLFQKVRTPHYMAGGGPIPRQRTNLSGLLGMDVQGALDIDRKAALSILHKQQAKVSSGSGAPSGGRAAPHGVVKDWLTAALKATNHFSPANLAALFSRTIQESGGNPKAINLTDSNAAAGHPSKGILQTIDSTFDSYKLPGHGDIWNPVDNAIAAIRYMFARYGHVVGASATGYARGGFAGAVRAAVGYSTPLGGGKLSFGNSKFPTRANGKRSKHPPRPHDIPGSFAQPGWGVETIRRYVEDTIPTLQERYSIAEDIANRTDETFIVQPADGSDPYIDWGAVGQRRGELSNLGGIETQVKGTIERAQSFVAPTMKVLGQAMAERVAQLNEIKRQFFENLKHLNEVRARIREHQKRIQELQKDLGSELKKKHPDQRKVAHLRDTIAWHHSQIPWLGQWERWYVGRNNQLGGSERSLTGGIWSKVSAARADLENQGTAVGGWQQDLVGRSGGGGWWHDSDETLSDLARQSAAIGDDQLASQLKAMLGGSSGASTAQTLYDQAVALYEEIKNVSDQVTGINAAQNPVFAEFAKEVAGLPYLGGFAHGTRRVPQTGLALLHRDEQVITDPEGPYGSQIARGGGSTRMSDINLHLHGDIGMIIRQALAEHEGRIVELVDRRLGQRTRQLTYAPNG
jgi:hypothetical protein